MTPSTPAGGAVAWIGAQLAEGWRFAYEPDTGYIGANHSQGGKRSVVRVDPWVPDEVGHAIAAMLNAPATAVGKWRAEATGFRAAADKAPNLTDSDRRFLRDNANMLEARADELESLTRGEK